MQETGCGHSREVYCTSMCLKGFLRHRTPRSFTHYGIIRMGRLVLGGMHGLRRWTASATVSAWKCLERMRWQWGDCVPLRENT